MGCSGDLSVLGTPDAETADRGADDVVGMPDEAAQSDRSEPKDGPADAVISDARRMDAGVDAVTATDAVSPTDVVASDVPRAMDVAATDAGTDVAREAAADVAVDVPRDAGMDAPRDVIAVMDVPMDVARDVPVGMDTAVDVPRDVAVDVPRDVTVDVPRDVVIDSGGFPPVPDDTVAYTGTFPERTGRFSATLTIMGVRRTVDLYVPASGGTGLPLVLMFHGTNGSGSQIMTDLNAQSLANANGFVVAAPTSRFIDHGDFDHPTAETYWETYPNVNPNSNVDVLLARAILVESQRVYGVDPDRVYALGHSSGGFFTLLLITTLQDRFAAFVENSAGLVECATTTTCRFRGTGATCDVLSGRSGWCGCSGTPKPNVLPTSGRQPAGYLTHGNDDPLVTVYYSCELLSQMNSLGWEAEMHVREGDGHDLQTTLLRDAWPFLSAHVRP